MNIERKDWESILKNETNADFFDAVLNAKKPVKIEKLVALIVRPQFEQNAAAFRDTAIGIVAISVWIIIMWLLVKS